MTRWLERYQSAKESLSRGGQAAADFDELPILSEALAGVPTPDGTGWLAPPQSLTLWFEGPQMKFAMGSQFNNIKTFGTTDGLSAGLRGVEKALENGHCETKKVKGTR